jgi:hypothetical protein
VTLGVCIKIPEPDLGQDFEGIVMNEMEEIAFLPAMKEADQIPENIQYSSRGGNPMAR